MATDRIHPIDEAELARLADGTLPERRRAVVERAVADSPALQAQLREQRQALDAVHAAAYEVAAPPSLRARVEAERRGRRSAPVARRRYALAAVAVAALVLAVLVALPSGSPGAPSVVQAAALGLQPPNGAAPAQYDESSALLNRSESGVPFPNWAQAFGWRPVGVRTDEVKGRGTTTVYYERGGKRLAYTIVSGKELKLPKGVWKGEQNGVKLWSLESGPRTVLVWDRKGHTCVMSSLGVSRAELAKLAAWKAQGRLPY
ncbi:MAG: anti-sigma factor family protein [Thermoleophilaceae bacterium]